jgi:hypothetical protein
VSARAKRFGVAGIVLVAVTALALFLVLNEHQLDQARADDTAHTTTFTWNSGVAAATLTTTSPADYAWVISFYHTPSGSSELFLAEHESDVARGWNPGAGAQATLQDTSFVSGDTVRARFRTYDSFGQGVFDFSRTLTVP